MGFDFSATFLPSSVCTLSSSCFLVIMGRLPVVRPTHPVSEQNSKRFKFKLRIEYPEKNIPANSSSKTLTCFFLSSFHLSFLSSSIGVNYFGPLCLSSCRLEGNCSSFYYEWIKSAAAPHCSWLIYLVNS